MSSSSSVQETLYQVAEQIVSQTPCHVVHEGYLHKQSKHLKLWNIRYFTLTSTQLSYKKKSGKKTKKAFDLHDVRVTRSKSAIVHAENFVFELDLQGKKHMVLSTASNHEREKWVRCIEETKISHLSQNDHSCAAQGHFFEHPLSNKQHIDSNKGGQRKLSSTLTSRRRPSWLAGKRVSRERAEERKLSKYHKTKLSLEEMWTDEILVQWNEKMTSQVEWLCFAGIPKNIRGLVWVTLLGNKLQINKELFEICKARAQGVKKEMEMKRLLEEKRRLATLEEKKKLVEAKDSIEKATSSMATDPHHDEKSVTMPSASNAFLAFELNEKDGGLFEKVTIYPDSFSFAFSNMIVDGERSIRLLSVDLPRTFGHHAFFKEGHPGYQRVHEVLDAYCCYRPDVGYVQGMSYIAATLCFHMDSLSAFKALVALLSKQMLFDMYRLERDRTFLYITTFDKVLELELPKLFIHFQEISLDPKMYMVDWALTLFTRCLPLELAYRLWDVFVLLGTPFFFQAAMGILLLYEDRLLHMDLGDAMKLVHEVPKDILSEDLFSAIDLVQISRVEITNLLRDGNIHPWSPVENHHVEVDFPDEYE